MAGTRLLDRGAGVDQLEAQLGGAAEQRLDVLGIVDPRQLHQDAVLALALNLRLLGAGLVDAAADDLDRLVHRLAPLRLGRNRAEGDCSGPVAGDRHGQVGVDLAQRVARRLDRCRIAQLEGDRRAFDLKAGIADVRVAQRVSDVVDDRVEPVALGGGDIHLQQQIRAATQIEAERHLLVRHRFGELCQKRRVEQVRQ